MDQDLPKFDAPPVVETLLSIQFAPLPRFSTAHAGWFWQLYLGGEAQDWQSANDAPRLEDEFERFGPSEAWGRMGFKLAPGGQPQRTQIIRKDEQRMIQVQDSRLVLNWRKRMEGYPSFEVLAPEFWKCFNAFTSMAQQAGLGAEIGRAHV